MAMRPAWSAAGSDDVSVGHVGRSGKQPSVEDDIEAQKNSLPDKYLGGPTRSVSSTSNDSTLAASELSPSKTWQVEEEALHGYPSLAAWIGNTENYAIYRSFKALNARNLLYQQAKITYLEHELNDLEKSLTEHTHLHYKVAYLFHEQERDSPGHKLRLKHEKLSLELGKYNHMLLQQFKIHQLPKADDMIVDSLWNIINSVKKGVWMQHPENVTYAVDDDTRMPIQRDLVTLNRAFRQQDPFTRFFTHQLLSWWHIIWSRFHAPDGDLDEYTYGDHAISRYMRACVMIAAAALPTASIVALYFIESAGWRLGFIVMFSGLFAAALTFFTEARSIDIFTASVALASVQVVFVGTAFGNGSNVS